MRLKRNFENMGIPQYEIQRILFMKKSNLRETENTAYNQVE